MKWALLVVALATGLVPASAQSLTESAEGGVKIEIMGPGTVRAGDDFAVSFLISNNGWEEKEQIMMRFSPGTYITGDNEIKIPKLAEGGKYGETIIFQAVPDIEPGTHYLNVEYSHILLENNKTPRNRTYLNIAIPIDVRDEPGITIHVISPESIFPDAEFPITIKIKTQYADLSGIRLEIIPPKELDFRGETQHLFSSLKKGDELEITSVILAPPSDLSTEYSMPFQIMLSYNDGTGEISETQSVPLILRPRTFMEITADGGIWLGNIFIAPYISLGTIIGVPAGAILSLLIRRRAKK